MSAFDDIYDSTSPVSLEMDGDCFPSFLSPIKSSNSGGSSIDNYSSISPVSNIINHIASPVSSIDLLSSRLSGGSVSNESDLTDDSVDMSVLLRQDAEICASSTQQQQQQPTYTDDVLDVDVSLMFGPSRGGVRVSESPLSPPQETDLSIVEEPALINPHLPAADFLAQFSSMAVRTSGGSKRSSDVAPVSSSHTTHTTNTTHTTHTCVPSNYSHTTRTSIPTAIQTVEPVAVRVERVSVEAAMPSAKLSAADFALAFTSMSDPTHTQTHTHAQTHVQQAFAATAPIVPVASVPMMTTMGFTPAPAPVPTITTTTTTATATHTQHMPQTDASYTFASELVDVCSELAALEEEDNDVMNLNISAELHKNRRRQELTTRQSELTQLVEDEKRENERRERMASVWAGLEGLSCLKTFQRQQQQQHAPPAPTPVQAQAKTERVQRAMPRVATVSRAAPKKVVEEPVARPRTARIVVSGPPSMLDRVPRKPVVVAPVAAVVPRRPLTRAIPAVKPRPKTTPSTSFVTPSTPKLKTVVRVPRVATVTKAKRVVKKEVEGRPKTAFGGRVTTAAAIPGAKTPLKRPFVPRCAASVKKAQPVVPAPVIPPSARKRPFVPRVMGTMRPKADSDKTEAATPARARPVVKPVIKSVSKPKRIVASPKPLAAAKPIMRRVTASKPEVKPVPKTTKSTKPVVEKPASKTPVRVKGAPMFTSPFSSPFLAKSMQGLSVKTPVILPSPENKRRAHNGQVSTAKRLRANTRDDPPSPSYPTLSPVHSPQLRLKPLSQKMGLSEKPSRIPTLNQGYSAIPYSLKDAENSETTNTQTHTHLSRSRVFTFGAQ